MINSLPGWVEHPTRYAAAFEPSLSSLQTRALCLSKMKIAFALALSLLLVGLCDAQGEVGSNDLLFSFDKRFSHSFVSSLSLRKSVQRFPVSFKMLGTYTTQQLAEVNRLSLLS